MIHDISRIARVTHSVNDRTEIGKLITESGDIYKSNPQKALKIAQKASELSLCINYTEGRVKSLIKEGQCYSILSQNETAIEKFNEALSLLSPENSLRRAEIFRNIGTAYYNQTQYEKALEYSFMSLEINRRDADKMGEAYALNNIATIYRNIGNFEQSLQYYYQSLKIKEELGDERTIYNTLSNMAVIYSTLEDYKNAHDFLFRSLQLIRKYNDKDGEAKALNFLGLCYRQEGDFERALKYCTKSRDINRVIGNKQNESYAVVNLGLINIDIENYEQAIVNLNEGSALSSEVGDMHGVATSLCHLGIVNIRLGNFDRAITELQKAQESAEEINDTDLIARINEELAAAYENKGDYKKASVHLKLCREAIGRNYKEMMNSKTKSLMLQYDVEKHQKEAELNKLRNVELQNAVEKLDKINEEKNNFIGIISHDIRDPVSSIYSLSDFIMNDIEDLSKEEVLDFAKDIKYSSDKVIKLLQALLDINAIETGKYNLKTEIINMCELLNSVIGSFEEKASAKNIKLVFNYSAEHYARFDRNSAEQIFTNLISNAVKYSPKNSAIFINILPGQDFVKVIVEDEGPGFNESDREKLFQKFTKLSARPTGGESSTGLGLSIVKQLVEMNKGKIECVSEYMKGAKFIVSFPNV